MLTGTNGCGKTTLLIALNRLGDNLAFSRNLRTSSAGFDSFKDAQIIYSTQMNLLLIIEQELDGFQPPKVKAI